MKYDRILYVDANTFVTGPTDRIFNELIIQTPTKTDFDKTSEIKADEAPLPANYVFAARSDNGHGGKIEHPIPPLQTKALNAGF